MAETQAIILTSAEQKDLLNEWFSTVDYVPPEDGIPALEEESEDPDDEVRSNFLPASWLLPEDLRLWLEARANPNHDPHSGKFASHGGSGSVAAGPGKGTDKVDDVNQVYRSTPTDQHGFYTESNRYQDANAKGHGQREDAVITLLVKEQGHGLPATGTKADVDAKIADGWTEGHRGVRDNKNGKSAGDQIEEMRTSKDFEYGSGVYGNGIYFSKDERVADAFTIKDPDAANPKSGTPVGKKVRVAIHPDAKLIDYDEVVKLRTADRAAAYERYKATGDRREIDAVDSVLRDPGRWATAKGYDGIVVKGKQDGVKVPDGKNGRKVRSKADQYVIFNRGVMIVEHD